MATASGDNAAALMAVIARQRAELDGLRARAAQRSVIDLARGILMERFRCSPDRARRQLESLAAEARTPLAELAADIAGSWEPGSWTEPPGGTEPGTEEPGAEGPGAVEPGEGRVPRQAGPGQEAAAGGGPPAIAAAGSRPVSLVRAATELAADGSELASAVLDHGLAPAGAVAVALWLIDPEGALELAGEAGMGAREASRWRYLPQSMECLPQRVARSGVAAWWPAGRPPQDSTPLIGWWPQGARAVLPLREDGPMLGVMEICWPQARGEFPAPMRREIAALAGVSAQALSTGLPNGGLAADHRAGWVFGLLESVLESVLVAAAEHGAGGEITDFRVDQVSQAFRDPAGRSRNDLAGRSICQLYPAAALAGGLRDVAAEVVSTGGPRRISGPVLGTFGAGAGAAAPVMDVHIAPLFDGVVITWRQADEAERLATMLQHAERLGRIGSWEENVLTGDVRWSETAAGLFGVSPGTTVPLAELGRQVPAEDLPAFERFRDTLLRRKQAAMSVFRVIRSDDGSLRQLRAFAEPVTGLTGDLVAVHGAYQDLSSHYHTQVALSATRERLADTEERAEEERRLALRLQQAITPWAPAPVEAAGLDVAARYRPAGPGNLVSGDWYDTVVLPGKQVLLVVGDVAGHGLDAVTGMVALRNSLRGLAITGAGPGALLGWLNGVACHLTENVTGTAICGLYDPGTRSLRWARAGHLPPVLVRGGAARQLGFPPGLMLGVQPATSYGEAVTSLDRGDALVLFTDGLIERRGEAIDDSVRSLLAVASQPVRDISGYADLLLGHASSDTGDDTCLVAVHLR